jgi:hypothetical protein
VIGGFDEDCIKVPYEMVALAALCSGLITNRRTWLTNEMIENLETRRDIAVSQTDAMYFGLKPSFVIRK